MGPSVYAFTRWPVWKLLALTKKLDPIAGRWSLTYSAFYADLGSDRDTAVVDGLFSEENSQRYMNECR